MIYGLLSVLYAIQNPVLCISVIQNSSNLVLIYVRALLHAIIIYCYTPIFHTFYIHSKNMIWYINTRVLIVTYSSKDNKILCRISETFFL